MKKPAQTRRESKEFEKFEALARKLVSVPKRDIQELEAKEKVSKIPARKSRS